MTSHSAEAVDCLEELTMIVEGRFPHHLEVCVCLQFPETSGSSSIFPSEPLPEFTVYGIGGEVHFTKAPAAHPSGCHLCSWLEYHCSVGSYTLPLEDLLIPIPTATHMELFVPACLPP